MTIDRPTSSGDDIHRRGAETRRSAEDEITAQVIGASIEVHRALGPGLLESVYEACLVYELKLRGLAVARQKAVPLTYKGHQLGTDLRIDLLVGDAVVVEVKSTESILPVHEAQLLTYLRLTGCHVGLLINFNVPALRTGVKRLVNNF